MDIKGNDVFQRVEKKYILSKVQYERLWERLKPYMQEDEYGLSTICNIYYDTPDYELIRTSIEKPVFKEKFRIRSYGVPKKEDFVYLEIKRKYDGVVYKRRTTLPYRDAEAFLEHGVQFGSYTYSQIEREIAYMHRQYPLQKRMFIAYDRIATYGKEDPSIRITFDFNIRAREDELDLTAGDRGEFYFRKQEVLMEIKVASAYPIWLSGILSELEIYPSSFSKYGTFYKEKLKGTQKPETEKAS